MRKYKNNRLFAVNNPLAPKLCPELAKEIGLNESLILLQVEYWLATEGRERNDGYLWMRVPVREIQETFVFLSTATIARVLNSLIKSKLLIAEDLDEGAGKSARWVRLGLDEVGKLKSVRLSQAETTVVSIEAESVSGCDNRPIKEDQDHSHACAREGEQLPADLPPVPIQSSKVAKRSRHLRSLGGNGRQPAAMTALPDPFTPGEQIFARATRDCPDVDLKLMHRAFCADRKSKARLSADWDSDWYAYMANCQSRINQEQKRYARSGT